MAKLLAAPLGLDLGRKSTCNTRERSRANQNWLIEGLFAFCFLGWRFCRRVTWRGWQLENMLFWRFGAHLPMCSMFNAFLVFFLCFPHFMKIKLFNLIVSVFRLTKLAHNGGCKRCFAPSFATCRLFLCDSVWARANLSGERAKKSHVTFGFESFTVVAPSADVSLC